MFFTALIRLGKKGNVNGTVLTIGTVAAIGIAGAGVAVSQFIKSSTDQAFTQEEAKKAELAMEALRRKFIFEGGTREWKVIDCSSGKKCVVPESQTSVSGSPFTDSTGKVTVSGAEGSQRISIQVPVIANLSESQMDTFFGSPSSAAPSELDNQTTPGTLNSQVVFSIDTATNPTTNAPGELIVRAVVRKLDSSEVPGPSGKVELATLPPPLPPTCTVAASRNGTGSTCTVTVTPAGDFTGSPSLPGVSLASSGTSWTSSSASCAQNSSTTFTATITGPGGNGSCSSPPVGPVVAPTCTVAATRNGTGSTCTVTVTPAGAASSATMTSPAGVGLTASGSNYINSSATCAQNSSTTFNATVTGPGGSSSCSSPPVGPVAPTCTVAASRNGTGSTCTVTVTPVGSTSGSPTIPGVSLTSSGSNWVSSSASCDQNSSSTFTATITGPGGNSSCSSTPVGPIAPTCSVSVARTGTSPLCTVTVTPVGVATGASISSPSGVGLSASGSNWVNSSAACPTTSSTTFTAIVSGPGGSTSCVSTPITAIPAPTCTISAARNSDNTTCLINMTTTGALNSPPSDPNIQISSNGVNYSAVFPSSPLWSGSSYSGNVDCPGYQNLKFKATVQGPGGTSSFCQSASISPVAAPTCSLEVARIGSTSDCSVIVNGLSGTITSVSVSPTTTLTQAGSQWSGTSTCSRTQSTTFTATASGPGSATPVSCGSKAIDALACYSDALGGNDVDVYSSGGKNYRFHKFTSSGTFTVNKSCKFDYLIVAGGGGGGGGSKAAAGGGAGGLLYSQNSTLGTGSYTITVGAGGSAEVNGANSILSGPGTSLTAIGGGRGGRGEGGWGGLAGAVGGSGGGGGIRSSGSISPTGGWGGGGTTGQGSSGGNAKGGNTIAGGGGGGAGGGGGGGDGVPGTGNMKTKGGNGGPGRQISITGVNQYYAGGGGGTGEENSGPGGEPGSGGAGGGGGGGGGAGAANTGGGGGGAGGSGGSGVVIVGYEIDFCSPGEYLSDDCNITNGTGVRTKTCNSSGLWGVTWGACSPVSCISGYSISGSTCAKQICSPNLTASQACTETNATSGTQSRTCASNGLSWSAWGACQATACASGFTLNNGDCTCSANTVESKVCTLANATSAAQSRTCASTGLSWSAWSTCQATACASTYSLTSGTCQKQICTPDSTASQACTVTNATSGTQSKTCASNGLSWSAWNTCQATACASGFTLNSGACTCTPGAKDYTTSGCTGGKTKSRTCNGTGTGYSAWGSCL